jgi:hypothetical protein
MSPQQPVRQLSAIPDTEVYSDDVMSDHKWFNVKPEHASAVSFVDSGLGLSFKSTDTSPPQTSDVGVGRSRPVPISGSLPARAFNSMASVFGKKRDAFSKSWSDLWDEEEEFAIEDIENDYMPFSDLRTEEELEHGSGVTTPRGGLTEMKNPAMVNNSRSRSPKSDRRPIEDVSQHTGFIFEDHAGAPPKYELHAVAPPKYSPPSKRSLLDKWAALGDRRRALQQQQQQQQQQKTPQKPTPQKTPKSKQTPATPTSARKRRMTPSSWKRPLQSQPENSAMWEKMGKWNASKDWRQHEAIPFSWNAPQTHHIDDIGDLEWVGGWNDHHL